MLLLIPVLLGIVMALMLGGSFHNLASLPVRGGYLIVASFAVQAALHIPALGSSAFVREHGGWIYVVALVLALAGVARNWHLGVAARVALLGLALNTTVIIFNDGYMPTNAAAMRSMQGAARVSDIAAHNHFINVRLATGSSRLLPLSDVVPVPFPFGHGNVFSAGDACIAAGAGALAYTGMRRKPGRPRPEITVPVSLQPAPGQDIL